MRYEQSRLRKWMEFASATLVALAVILLPITSQPVLSRLMGYSLVAPPTIILIAITGVIWLPLFLMQGGKLPAESRPFIAFVLVAAVSSLAAFFIRLPAYQNFSVFDGEKDALLTFSIAVGVYFLVALWFRTVKQLTLAAALINISGFVLVAWCLTQLFVILARGGEYPGWMVRIQFHASVRSLLDHVYLTRVGGFAYEPSWLAHQLNILYIPFWFAATVTGFSSLRKVAGFSLENVLLAGGIIALFFSFSRVGLLALVFMLAYVLWRLHARGLAWVEKRWNRKLSIWMRFFVLAGLLLLYLALLFLVLSIMGRLDARFERLLSLQDFNLGFFELAFRVDFAERVVYWANGLQTFARHPVIGIGLGNTGFFFAQHLPAIASRLNEIVYVLTYEYYLPNVKSFWVRLLSETGVVGFSLFCTWLFVLWKAGKNLEKQTAPVFRLFGWMVFFVVAAFIAEGFSIDSFALPYLWVSLGMVTAASAIARRTTNSQPIIRSS